MTDLSNLPASRMKSPTTLQVEGRYLSANCMFKVPWGQVMMLTLPPPLMADT